MSNAKHRKNMSRFDYWLTFLAHRSYKQAGAGRSFVTRLGSAGHAVKKPSDYAEEELRKQENGGGRKTAPTFTSTTKGGSRFRSRKPGIKLVAHRLCDCL